MIEHQLARPMDDHPPLRGISEAEVIAAYGSSLQARPCVCGGMVVADPRDPTEGVQEHQAEPKHQAWRAWVEL